MLYTVITLLTLVLLMVALTIYVSLSLIRTLYRYPLIKLFDRTSNTVEFDYLPTKSPIKLLFEPLRYHKLWRGGYTYTITPFNMLLGLSKTSFGRSVLWAMLTGRYQELYGYQYLIERKIMNYDKHLCLVKFERDFRPGEINVVYGRINGCCMTTIFIDDPMDGKTWKLNAAGTGFDFVHDNFIIEPVVPNSEGHKVYDRWEIACKEFGSKLMKSGASYSHTKACFCSKNDGSLWSWDKNIPNNTNSK